MDNNWIIENLENAFATWNGKLAEIWGLLSTSPQNFKGGGVWNAMVNINGALTAIGYGLLVLFLAMGIFGSTLNFRDFKRPEQALRFFIRFVAAKAAVTYGMELMTALFDICFGVVHTASGQIGSMTAATVSLPGEIRTAIEEMGFFESIPLWLVTLIGSLFITVLSFVLILTVYGRFFRLYMYTALAPIPLSTFAAESTASTGKAFIKSYLGVCLEGAVIVLACVIFTGFIDGDPVYGGGSAVTMAWSYLGEVVFNMLVLVILVKGSDRIIKEMLGL
ncbi:hypothetical protein [Anaerotruncus rubiinfantis]|uniref:hypothetical protein n=1 Tax=Anaerotruncus rubiinfantis TaxID=1720200 RepID=UPI0011CBC12F|nr:hypothetical protein [Anaerotruncus rubiinfantis]